MLKNKKGFTIVEMLVVLVVVGMLLTFSVILFGDSRRKARDGRRVSDIQQIQKALELYLSHNDVYPAVAGPTILGSTGFTKLTENGFSASGSTSYIDRVPENLKPSAEAPGAVAVTNPGNSPDYVYVSLNADGTTCSNYCTNYNLAFTLETGGAGLPAGPHDAWPGGVK